jgi:uncharacterized membrane protein YdbT with pleckstrin-like domain
MINYFDILLNSFHWSLGLIIFVASFTAPSFFVGFLMAIFGVIYIFQAIDYMHTAFEVDEKVYRYLND